MVFPEEIVNIALPSKDLRHRAGVNILQESMFGASGQHLVRSQLQIQVLPSQQLVHQGDHLQDELILTQVIAMLENGRVLVMGNRCDKGESIKVRKKVLQEVLQL